MLYYLSRTIIWNYKEESHKSSKQVKNVLILSVIHFKDCISLTYLTLKYLERRIYSTCLHSYGWIEIS